MPFDFDSATRRKLGYKLIDHIDAFYSSLPDRPVQLPANQRTYGPLNDPLPEDGTDPKHRTDKSAIIATRAAQQAQKEWVCPEWPFRDQRGDVNSSIIRY